MKDLAINVVGGLIVLAIGTVAGIIWSAWLAPVFDASPGAFLAYTAFVLICGVALGALVGWRVREKRARAEVAKVEEQARKESEEAAKDMRELEDAHASRTTALEKDHARKMEGLNVARDALEKAMADQKRVLDDALAQRDAEISELAEKVAVLEADPELDAAAAEFRRMPVHERQLCRLAYEMEGMGPLCQDDLIAIARAWPTRASEEHGFVELTDGEMDGLSMVRPTQKLERLFAGRPQLHKEAVADIYNIEHANDLVEAVNGDGEPVVIRRVARPSDVIMQGKRGFVVSPSNTIERAAGVEQCQPAEEME